VEAADEASSRIGRPVLADFAPEQGTIGVPADSRGVFAVTAMDLEGRPRPYGVIGTPAYLDLAQRQLLFVPDQVGAGTGPAFGTTLSNAFAAGMAASFLSSGQSRAEVDAWLRQHQGYALRLPAR
jgi:hypothetical protein